MKNEDFLSAWEVSKWYQVFLFNRKKTYWFHFEFQLDQIWSMRLGSIMAACWVGNLCDVRFVTCGVWSRDTVDLLQPVMVWCFCFPYCCCSVRWLTLDYVRGLLSRPCVHCRCLDNIFTTQKACNHSFLYKQCKLSVWLYELVQRWINKKILVLIWLFIFGIMKLWGWLWGWLVINVGMNISQVM